MGITEHKIAEEIGIKDRGTITTWYNGTNPRPKYRVKLTRFFNRMQKIAQMTTPTDELMDEACENRPSWDGLPSWDDENPAPVLLDMRSMLQWTQRGAPRWPSREYIREDIRRRQEGLPTQQEEREERNAEMFTDEWKIHIITNYHPCEYTRQHFNGLVEA